MKTFYRKLKNSKEPKYLRIYGAVVDSIRDGTLRAQEPLPSSRELAKLYACHRLTVMTAMQALVAEGWLVAAERSHYRVSEKIPVTSSKAVHGRIRGSCSVPAAKNKPPEFDLEKSTYKLAFWGGTPDLRLFPMKEYRSAVADSLQRLKPETLGYGHIDGLPPLKKQVSAYLRRTRNLVDRDLIVTNGSQEALYIIAQTYIRPGDRIAIEGKGYPPVWRLFESLGAELVAIGVDDEGLNTIELEEIIQKKPVKMVYTTPLHQYPTTVSLSPRRRQELIRIAELNRILILEDDYDHEFHYLGPPPPPLSSETSQAIYICSFSKVLFPGTRLGVIACEPKLSEDLCYQKYLVSRQTECLSQLALAHWLQAGGFERHLRRMRRAYEKRYYFMLEQLELLRSRHDIEWRQPTGGMSIWLDLKQNSRKVASEAKALGIFFQNEREMDYQNADGTHLRIGFAGANEKEIEEGLSILAKLLKTRPTRKN